MTLEVLPIEGLPEIVPGDDIAALFLPALRAMDVGATDVVVVTQKVVSKAEGRVVPADEQAAWVRAETARVVARRGDLVIAETRHGFVCANAGVDASNVAAGTLTLLPDDPDASAESLRVALASLLGGHGPAVVITDTFGRPWREGLVDVAIGVAGMPVTVDLRGTVDRAGRDLTMTVVAVADQVAAAAGMVMSKTAGVPVAVVRGALAVAGDDWRDAGGTSWGRATDLVRDPADDLFRESPLQALHARRTIRSFASGGVDRTVIADAIAAACTAPAPHHTRPWLFVALDAAPSKRALLAALAGAWRADLVTDGVPAGTIERRIARSNAVLGAAPTLIVPFVRFDGAHLYPDAERGGAEREMFLLSGGAAIQNLLLALHAQLVGSCWISSTLFCQRETRDALGVDDGWYALGTVACGPMPGDGAVRPRPPIDLDDVLSWR